MGLKITVTLPLKNWEKCGLCCETILTFCKKKISEYEKQLKLINSTDARYESPLSDHLRMYKLCSDILHLAIHCRSVLYETMYSKCTGIVKFVFSFASESLFDDFYSGLKKLFKDYTLYELPHEERDDW